MTHADQGNFQDAIAFLERSIANSRPAESHLRKAYALLVYSYGQAGRNDEAEKTCREGLRLFPKDAELLFRDAMLLHEKGDLKKAAETYLQVLEKEDDRHFSSLD
jgi:tetratricopeptide (TPR) repeat protein